MQEKLREINSEFQDSEVLVDFVNAMMEGGKSKSFVYSELCESI
jgi:hypothetical protein